MTEQPCGVLAVHGLPPTPGNTGAGVGLGVAAGVGVGAGVGPAVVVVPDGRPKTTVTNGLKLKYKKQ